MKRGKSKLKMIHCTFENHNPASLRHVVVDALVIKDEKILLVRRAPPGIEAGKLALPGGFLDRDETTAQGVAREVQEETGYRVTKTQLFRIVDNPQRKGEDRQNVSFVYIVEVGEKVGESDHEVEQVEWYALDQLPDPAEVAFDHWEHVALYLKYRQERFSLPIIG